MPASSSVSQREPIRTKSEAAATAVAVFSRTSTVRPPGSCWRTGCAAALPAPAHPRAATTARAAARRAAHCARPRGTKASRA